MNAKKLPLILLALAATLAACGSSSSNSMAKCDAMVVRVNDTPAGTPEHDQAMTDWEACRAKSSPDPGYQYQSQDQDQYSHVSPSEAAIPQLWDITPPSTRRLICSRYYVGGTTYLNDLAQNNSAKTRGATALQWDYFLDAVC